MNVVRTARISMLFAAMALVAGHHAVAIAASAPEAADRLHPRLPVDNAGGYTLPTIDDVSLDTAEERIALSILERHPSGLPRAAVRETAKTVIAEAHANGLDPMLVLGLIRVESTNWNWSRSDKDARGLMQLLVPTGKSLARGAHVAWRGPNSLYDPKVNVRLGTRYLAQLRDRFDGSIPKALTAYNMGPNRLAKQLKRNVHSDEYATKILWFTERYNAIAAHGDDLAPGIARVNLALDQIERDIDYKPAVALASARRAHIASRRADLNRITFADLLMLDPEMTPKLARTIMDARAANGGFRSVDDLDGLGLGSSLTKRLHERVRVTNVVHTVAVR